MLWLGLCLGIAAWCLLSLGLEKHHRQVFASAFDASRARLLRAAGWLLLAVDFGLFVYGWGWAQGPIFWTAALIISALAWSVLMTMLPRASTKIAAVALLSAVVLIPFWAG
ncbi:DUF3325 domain-containing protein [Lysobacter capsici]|uniref:DUF3325 domain-containing protein n=1 Tax=Lysobacter capsici TaxID=435897 RepID=UPI001C00740D|nr:DUF3325 domain-containing protein [Lysobacter capsici]QWF18566.1 DUF3325 domain-containing protein [Lysobacter capsici]